MRQRGEELQLINFKGIQIRDNGMECSKYIFKNTDY